MSRSRSLSNRLRDIIDSADLAELHAAGLDASSLAAASGVRDATLFRICVIGEAAAYLPAEIQALASEMPWKDVTSMRNHIIHGYWQVDFKIVVDTITTDLEPLKAAVRRLIAVTESPNK
jgi:uncharacterized protein with HEPN domain